MGVISGLPVTETASWQPLKALGDSFQKTHIRDLFLANPARATELVFQAGPISVDFSRQRADTHVFKALHALIAERDVLGARDQMFAGDPINVTENRSVLHTALRLPRNAELLVDGKNVVPDIHEVLDRMGKLADEIRSGDWKGATGESIRHIVNIGIGGSDLGPVMAYEALRSFSQRDLSFHFVSNVDGADLMEVLRQIDITKTLFIVASKTFTTQETMMNANSAREFLYEAVSRKSGEVTAKHFVALSTNAQKVTEFGIDPKNMFGFWDWVGGRYSMDSAIGLSTMIAIGSAQFTQMLSGFYEMDQHFKTADVTKNVPILMAALGFWNRSLLNINTVAVLPYDQYLKRFPAYLQQLIMESNGKSVTRDGAGVGVETGSVYWGEPGTNGQHSFYQLIHQGTSIIACDVIVPAKSQNDLQAHHDALVSNAISQAHVLAFGRDQVKLTELNVAPELIAHKVMPGNRPTTLMTFEQVDPKTLGALVALYEHMVFVQGILWGINSFDQWGVELGKEVANSILPKLTSTDSTAEFDSATIRAIDWYRKNR